MSFVGISCWRPDKSQPTIPKPPFSHSYPPSIAHPLSYQSKIHFFTFLSISF
ncbi:hypothetical protein HanRHA438_Chr15g0706431 [Helianthus annuus]|uniref:Uncharacterized protein n=1 Tax=Helianthus annuus TaxID=4232 RepID=A0A251VLG0_HELAN|nr:hypothetical protein HanXRQr2_Chr15g0694091 [Helianthus annuus]KAJ0451265.1 hypothetical protein HanHA300_Chr15g0565611 [Helianthus annuus]KAJ0455728.1 hypothetical protein HanIR_Chr15g0754411 [Helianthus annuus]KAJ0473134.1 hypothetical protein HanHA89_Chr15g0614891 [Helianthus annuus]KAJ0648736.1 hypothetical protein HanLR1_Chr15g0576251 [Helianthus annuus]